MRTTRELQERLKAEGFDPGKIDGAPGANTRRAVAAYQKARGLEVDEVAGPKTWASLDQDLENLTGSSVQPRLIVPPWYEIAEAHRKAGIDERGDRAEIAEWASDLGIRNFDATTVPWCGLEVAACVSQALPNEPLPSNILGARNWAKLGVECEPQLGAIMVFWRESKASGKGHVGFYAGEDVQAYHILGGNQGDAVTITRVAKSRFIGARWPKTSQFLATGKKVQLGAGGSLSQNEA